MIYKFKCKTIEYDYLEVELISDLNISISANKPEIQERKEIPVILDKQDISDLIEALIVLETKMKYE
jgi:hypothetical protein